MPTTQTRRPSQPSRMIALVTVCALGLTAGPAVLAAAVVTQDVISVQRVGRSPDVRHVMATRLTVPPQAVWETDPDAGPLTLTVETGVLGVRLGGGSARLEQHANILLDEPTMAEQITPLPPGHLAALRPGDRLVIVRGFQLTVTNDEGEPATAILRRLQQPAVLTADGTSTTSTP